MAKVFANPLKHSTSQKYRLEYDKVAFLSTHSRHSRSNSLVSVWISVKRAAIMRKSSFNIAVSQVTARRRATLLVNWTVSLLTAV